MKNCLPILNKILKHGVMSPMLKEAIKETIKAIEEKNLNLAYQITACKSYLVGVIDPKDKVNAFQEDEEKNEELFDRSIYILLDGVHHEISFAIDSIPSGMMNLKYNGEVKKFQSNGIHPIIKRIKHEDEVIRKGVKKYEDLM